MGTMGTNFTAIIEARSVGTPDIEKLTNAIDKQSTALEGLGKSANKINEHPGFSAFAEKIKSGIQDPLGAIGDAAKGTLEALGPMGTGVVSAAGAFAAFAKVSMDAARSLGEYAISIESVSIRTGLSTKEVGQFSFAAKLAGQDISVFESAMRKLSQGLVDSSEAGKRSREALQEIGVHAANITDGSMRPMSEVFLQISQGLNGIADPAKRDAAALDIFGRVGIELLPTLLKLSKGVERAKELGLGPNDEDIKQWDEYHRRMTEVDAAWDRIVRKLKAGVAVPIMWFFGDGKSINDKGMAAGGSVFAQGEVNSDIIGNTLRRTIAANMDMARNAPFADSIRRNDAAVEAALMGTTEEQLARAKNKLTQDLAKLKTGVLPSVNAPTQSAIRDDREKIAALEARVEATKKLKASEAELLEIEKQAREALEHSYSADLGDFGKISFARVGIQRAQSAELAKVGDNPALRGRVIGAYALQLAANDQEMVTAVRKWTAAAIKEFESSPTPDLLKAFEARSKEWESSGLTDRRGNLAFAGSAGYLAPPEGYISPEQQLRDARRGNSRALGLYSASASLSGVSEVGQTAGLYALREQSAQKEYAANMRLADAKSVGWDKEQARLDAEDQKKESIFQAQLERDQRILEMAARQKDAFASGFAGMIQQLQGGGSLSSFMRNWATNLEGQVLRNIGGMIWGDPQSGSGLSRLIPRASGEVGKLLSGTAFGSDSSSLKLSGAGDRLSLAANDLMSAARTLAASPTGGGGGWPTGGYSAASPWAAAADLGGGAYSSGYTSDGVQRFSPENYAEDGTFLGVGATNSHDTSIAPISRTMTGRSMFGSVAGVGAAALGSGFGIYSGLRQGGAQGGLTAAAAGIGGATAIISLLDKTLGKTLGPIGGLASMGLGLVASLMGNPKEKYAEREAAMLRGARYVEPESNSYSYDRYGSETSYAVNGGSRTSGQNVTILVQTLDSKSFSDNAHLVANALTVALESKNNPRTAAAIRNTAFSRS
jgi:hypothetical protein